MKRRWMSAFALTALGLGACDDAPKSAAPTKPEAKSEAATSGVEEAKKAASAKPEVAPKATAKDVIATDDGDVKVTPLGHGSVLLTWKGKNIYVDPVSAQLDKLASPPKADLVLVTHIHPDHLDPRAIASVRAEGAPVITPKSVAEKAGEALASPTILANGQTKEVLSGAVEVEAFPMYNLVRKRPDGEFFHPKGRGNGYVVTLGGARLYFSGDTECTPELEALADIDAAFLCMNLPYTMPVEEAGACAATFKPKILFPYHHRDQDPAKLASLIPADAGVEIRRLDWYPAPAGDAEKHEH